MSRVLGAYCGGAGPPYHFSQKPWKSIATVVLNAKRASVRVQNRGFAVIKPKTLSSTPPPSFTVLQTWCQVEGSRAPHTVFLTSIWPKIPLGVRLWSQNFEFANKKAWKLLERPKSTLGSFWAQNWSRRAENPQSQISDDTDPSQTTQYSLRSVFRMCVLSQKNENALVFCTTQNTLPTTNLLELHKNAWELAPQTLLRT